MVKPLQDFINTTNFFYGTKWIKVNKKNQPFYTIKVSVYQKQQKDSLKLSMSRLEIKLGYSCPSDCYSVKHIGF